MAEKRNVRKGGSAIKTFQGKGPAFTNMHSIQTTDELDHKYYKTTSTLYTHTSD